MVAVFSPATVLRNASARSGMDAKWVSPSSAA
jgi:hypothetical protein